MYNGIGFTPIGGSAMIRLTFFFSFAVSIVVLCLSAVPVFAQDVEAVQKDYDRYAQLFKIGREPNLSHDPLKSSAASRRSMRDNRWKEHAEGNEGKEPILAAQVLMGIYLISFVDYELTDHIDSIIRHKASLSISLLERITLEKIDWRLKENPELAEAIRRADSLTLNSEEHIEKIQQMIRDIDTIARNRMKNGTTRSGRQRAEIRALQHFFAQGEKGWVATYRFMREKLDILDSLADSFKTGDKRHQTFKDIVGTYQSTEHHKETLEKAHFYFRVAAEQGNPIAQYHLALFLKYLGDRIDADKEEVAAYQKWLDQAGNTDLAKGRVEEVKAQLAEEEEKAPKRKEMTDKRVAALLKIENQKMGMFEMAIIMGEQGRFPPNRL
jgi:hypothetical protein